MEDPRTASTAAKRLEQAQLVQRARQACAQCPALHRCLYFAVVEHDVAGYVAQTTVSQRNAIRQRLGIKVGTEDLDRISGALAPNRQIDPHEVVRLRAANPHDSLESLAQRLGCSLSTVKRHLRRARNDAPLTQPKPGPRPTMDEVLAATRCVLGIGRPNHAAA
ncbi:WhiB family transcriptional regulator [Luteococcus sediminum]